MQNQASIKVKWSWISQAWKMITDKLGVWISMMLIYIAISIGLSLVFSFLGGAVSSLTIGTITPENPTPSPAIFIIPVLIQLLSIVVSIPVNAFFMTGFFKTAIKQAMGGHISVDDLFSGGERFWAVLRFFLIMYLITFILLAIILVPSYFLGLNEIISLANQTTGVPPAPEVIMGLFGKFFLIYLIFIIIHLFVYSGMFYSIPGIIHSRWGAIESIRKSFQMVGSNIFMYVIFMIVGSLLSASGMIACCIGLLVTMPFYFTIPAVAYSEVIGDVDDSLPMPPPPPDHWMNDPQ